MTNKKNKSMITEDEMYNNKRRIIKYITDDKLELLAEFLIDKILPKNDEINILYDNKNYWINKEEYQFKTLSKDEDTIIEFSNFLYGINKPYKGLKLYTFKCSLILSPDYPFIIKNEIFVESTGSNEIIIDTEKENIIYDLFGERFLTNANICIMHDVIRMPIVSGVFSN